ncbi:MAG: DUF2115 domain-containing protein [Methanomicrobiales archaeon]|nr:DUF2115 domain-containing protein [Methanomicrobiales archaeon]
MSSADGRIGVSEIPDLCELLRSAGTRQELIERIHRIVRRYTLQDLQLLRGAVERELMYLPRSYRDRLYPKLIEQIFGTHHMILTMCQSGIEFQGPLDPSFRSYCDMIEQACLNGPSPIHPRFQLLHFILTAFLIFVLHMPAHPVGTPFPGGLKVREKNGTYYCPVKEKEGDVEYAICRFCPAKQENSG